MNTTFHSAREPSLFGIYLREAGSELLRHWVDDPAATPADLDTLAKADEDSWMEERKSVLRYS